MGVRDTKHQVAIDVFIKGVNQLNVLSDNLSEIASDLNLLDRQRNKQGPFDEAQLRRAEKFKRLVREINKEIETGSFGENSRAGKKFLSNYGGAHYQHVQNTRSAAGFLNDPILRRYLGKNGQLNLSGASKADTLHIQSLLGGLGQFDLRSRSTRQGLGDNVELVRVLKTTSEKRIRAQLQLLAEDEKQVNIAKRATKAAEREEERRSKAADRARARQEAANRKIEQAQEREARAKQKVADKEALVAARVADARTRLAALPNLNQRQTGRFMSFVTGRPQFGTNAPSTQQSIDVREIMRTFKGTPYEAAAIDHLRSLGYIPPGGRGYGGRGYGGGGSGGSGGGRGSAGGGGFFRAFGRGIVAVGSGGAYVLGRAGLPLYGLGGGALAYAGFAGIRSSLQAYSQMQDQRTFLSGTFNQFKRYIGPDGKPMSAGDNYRTAITDANSFYNVIRQKAVESPLTIQELFSAYTRSAPFLLGRGLSDKASLDVINKVNILGKVAGLHPESVADDVRDLSSGNFRNAQSFQMLGVDTSKFRDISKLTGKALESALEDIFKSVNPMLEEYENNFSAKMARISDAFLLIGQTIGESLAPTVISAAEEITKAVKDAEANGGLKEAANNISAIMGTLVSAAKWIVSEDGQNFFTNLGGHTSAWGGGISDFVDKIRRGDFWTVMAPGSSLIQSLGSNYSAQMAKAAAPAGNKRTETFEWYLKKEEEKIRKSGNLKYTDPQDIVHRHALTGEILSRKPGGEPTLNIAGRQLARERALALWNSDKKGNAGATSKGSPAYTPKNQMQGRQQKTGSGNSSSGTGVSIDKTSFDTTGLETKLSQSAGREMILELGIYRANRRAEDHFANYNFSAGIAELNSIGAKQRQIYNERVQQANLDQQIGNLSKGTYSISDRSNQPLTFITARAKKDFESGNVNPELIGVLQQLKGAGFDLGLGTFRTGHAEFTTSGNKSRHSYGNAVDAPTINGLKLGQKGYRETMLRAQAWAVANLGAKTSESGAGLSFLFGYDDKARGGNHNNHAHIGVSGSFKLSGLQHKLETKQTELANAIAKNNTAKIEAVSKEIIDLEKETNELKDRIREAKSSQISYDFSMAAGLADFNIAVKSGSRMSSYKRQLFDNDNRTADVFRQIHELSSQANLRGGDVTKDPRYMHLQAQLIQLQNERRLINENEDLAKLNFSNQMFSINASGRNLGVTEADFRGRQADAKSEAGRTWGLALTQAMQAGDNDAIRLANANYRATMARINKESSDFDRQKVRSTQDAAYQFNVSAPGLTDAQRYDLESQRLRTDFKRSIEDGQGFYSAMFTYAGDMRNLSYARKIALQKRYGTYSYENKTGRRELMTSVGEAAAYAIASGQNPLDAMATLFQSPISGYINRMGDSNLQWRGKGGRGEAGAQLGAYLGATAIVNGVFGADNVGAQTGGAIGSMVASLLPTTMLGPLAPFAAAIGFLGGGILGGLFGKRRDPEAEARKQHQKKVEELLASIDKSLRPQPDYFRSINRDALFGQSSAYYSSRALTGLGMQVAMGGV